MQDAWRQYVLLTTPPAKFITPAKPVVQQEGHDVLIETGDGDDRVYVRRNADTGEVTVTVNGAQHRFSATEAEHITIRTQGGDDAVNVAPDMPLSVTIEGGDGNDALTGGAGDDTIDGGRGDDILAGGRGNDRVSGGGGDDRVHAGAGDDEVDGGGGDDYIDGFTGRDELRGGGGADTIYGGVGNDAIHGGAGRDYLDGYLGDDVIAGGRGDDVISGGRGEDLLLGGGGDDVIYTGAGQDFVLDYAGVNSIYHQAEDILLVNEATRNNPNTVTVGIVATPDNIRIEGSPEFEARMRADLETLAASPTGQQMLAEINRLGGALPIYEMFFNIENGFNFGFGVYNLTLINPAFHLDDDDGRVPPIIVLHHEMAHAYARMSGAWAAGEFHDDRDPTNPDTGVHNAERQAVGLTIDHDEDPSTPAIIDPDYPQALTENALRGEMGYGLREDYR